MYVTARRREGGSTLLEVMLAVSIVAIGALGIAATQLALIRSTHTADARERAALVADGIAEAAWGGDPVRADAWFTHALAALRRGAVTVVASGAQASVAVVSWETIPSSMDAAAASRACGNADVAASRACVSLAFGR